MDGLIDLDHRLDWVGLEVWIRVTDGSRNLFRSIWRWVPFCCMSAAPSLEPLPGASPPVNCALGSGKGKTVLRQASRNSNIDARTLCWPGRYCTRSASSPEGAVRRCWSFLIALG